MPRLTLTCFDTLQVNLDSQPATFRSTKDRALLVYLALEQERTHTREFLAGLLWPDEAETRARRNLSTALLNLRKAIGDRTNDPPFLLTTSQTIAFNPASDHRVDVLAFEAHLTTVHEHVHPVLTACATCAQVLEAAVDLYRGPFLDGFAVAESDLFEQWMRIRREKLHRRALDAFTALSTYHETQGALPQAVAVAQRLLNLAPWQEEAHRQLMRLLALNGQRTQALAQYEACCQALDDELGVLPSAATNAIYDQILAGEIGPASFAIAPAVDASEEPLVSPFQAIALTPHFAGRAAETGQLQDALMQTNAPIMALVGMGGAGKTTLATQVAHQTRDTYRDGVLWANAATSTPLDNLAQWGHAYGYDFEGLTDLESRAAAVRSMLAEKRALIVVDNVTNAAQVRPLLPGSASCAVLLTTRDLDVAHALNAQTLPVGELEAVGARQLLVNILGSERILAEADAAAEICALLHYLPLAVEIAAQRLKSRPRMKLAAMTTRLRHEQHRLGLEMSDQAVRTSFMVSWDALDEELQRIFALLAVFEGRHFTIDVVAYLANIDKFDAEDQLFALTALSLLKEEDADGYFWQHPLLADFAHEQLIQVDEAYARMAAYYLTFAQENNQNYDALEPEWGNLMGAIAAAHRLAQWSQVIEFMDALAKTWQPRGRCSEARRAYRWSQEAAEKLEDEELQARNLVQWGKMCIEQNDYDEARKLLTDSLDHYYRLEEGPGIAEAYYHLAHIARDQSRYDEAQKFAKESLSIRVQLSDQAGIAIGLFQQASIHFLLGELMPAQRLAEEALSIQRKIESEPNLIPTLRLLAQIMARNKEHELALSYGQMALQLSEEFQDESELAATLYTLTIVFRRTANFEVALRYADRGRLLFQRLGLRRVEGMVLYQKSTIHKELGNYQEARGLAIQSIEIHKQLQNLTGCLFALIHLGDIYHHLKQIDRSRAAWLEAKETAIELNDRALLSELEERLGA